ncbi:hypothetical protein BOX15_Mlig015121g1 [Macrostomum lignano]|uniref:t-SNARE coiled-coil homology domain-containing protein n=3 Tax=Macrostomum lignano TaxID=282301 RepID=A0A267EHJ1_9PLAT|nr:hypothetical protein BOX15_Mlig015121g1 [Macrostomum lignano]
MSTDDERFANLAAEISQLVTGVQTNTGQIRNLSNKIGTDRDSEALRSQIHSLTHTTLSQCQRATEQLKRDLTPMCQGMAAAMRRVQKDRLVDQVTKVAGDFQEVQRLVQAREKEAAAKQRREAGGSGLDSLFDQQQQQPAQLVDADSPFRLGGQQQQQQQQLDLQAAEQREQQLHQLEQDIVGINELFKDLAHMVHDQGEMLDSIEDHVSEAVMHVETGNKQLGKAVSYKRSARRKKIILAIIVLIVLLVIGLVIYLSVRSNN